MLLKKRSNVVVWLLVIVACTNYAIFVTRTARKTSEGAESVFDSLSVAGETRDGSRASPVHLICRDTPGRHCLGSTKGDSCTAIKAYGHYSCKASCALCSQTAIEISADIGLPVKLVDTAVGCVDTAIECPTFKLDGKCESDPSSMLQECRKTCGFCDIKSQRPRGASRCADDIDICPYLAATGVCSSGLPWVLPLCRQSCDSCSLFPGDHHTDLPLAHRTFITPLVHLRKAIPQQQDASLTSNSGNNVLDAQTSADDAALEAGHQQAAGADASSAGSEVVKATDVQWLDIPCKDSSPSCEDWHKAGECSKNPAFMAQTCMHSCGTCRVAWMPQPPKFVGMPGGREMPSVGFGTAGLGDLTGQAVGLALEAGYRHIDSAQAREWYREDLVGAALSLWYSTTGSRREDLFIVSKLHPRHHGYDTAMRQFNSSLADLGTGYLDLFLLHYPACWGDLCGGATPQGTWQDSWKALEELVEQGKIRAIGVSNFGLSELQQLVRVARVRPALLQVNSDPSHPNHALQRFCREERIQFEAYSSLGTQWLAANGGVNPVLGSPVLQEMAARKQRSVAQVVLRWGLQLGQVVIPRSANKQHISQNLELFDFDLDESDMLAIHTISSQGVS